MLKEEDKKRLQERFQEEASDVYQPFSKELFKQYSVKRGLRNDDGTGVMAGLTSVGAVLGYYIDDGEKIPMEGHLRYRGYDLTDIVKNCEKEKRFGFEEVAYLLLFGHLPDKKTLDDFSRLIGNLRVLPEGFAEDMILKAPSKNIMNKIARSVLASYSYDSNPDDISTGNILRQSIELIARLPVMAAYGYQAKSHYHDGKSLYLHTPQPRLSTAFTTRVVSSSDTDTYSAIAAAIGSLKGPKHGGANAKVMGMMEEIKANVKHWEDDEEVKAFLAKILRKEAFDGSGLIYGMGHAIYTYSDPRCILLKEKAGQLVSNHPEFEKEFKLYCSVERLTPGVFAEVKNNHKVMCANVDMYSGFVYKMLGIPTEMYTPLFAISRIVGWCAHRLEEVIGCGRIIRPAYKSMVHSKEYTKIDNR